MALFDELLASNSYEAIKKMLRVLEAYHGDCECDACDSGRKALEDLRVGMLGKPAEEERRINIRHFPEIELRLIRGGRA